MPVGVNVNLDRQPGAVDRAIERAKESGFRARVSILQDLLRVKLVKGFLKNLDADITTEFLFNPVELEESYVANYARLAVPGLSHQRLQFTGNSNVRIPLRLIYDQLVVNRLRGSGQPTTGGDTEFWRLHLISLIYPRRSQRINSASPPPVMFHWPGMITMRVRVMTLRFRHLAFMSGTLRPRILVAEVALEEEPLRRIFSERRLSRQRTIRPWAASDLPRGRRR